MDGVRKKTSPLLPVGLYHPGMPQAEWAFPQVPPQYSRVLTCSPWSELQVQFAYAYGCVKYNWRPGHHPSGFK